MQLGTAPATSPIGPVEQLRERIASRTAQIGIVGLGYVGLPTAVAYAQAGFPVTGIDLDIRRCASINSGRSHVEDIDDATLKPLVREGRLRAVRSVELAGDLDVVDVCVPTPLDKSREPDLSAIVAVVDVLRPLLRPGQLIVLTSTTYPGTTEEIVLPAIEGAGLRVGEDIFLAFAPERIDPGNKAYTLRTTPKVVGGITPACTEIAAALFSTIIDQVVTVSNATAAEMTKLLENTFRSINIGLANEVAIMCHHLGIDVWEVIRAASTKPYGFMPFFPGPGLGGHCIPIDPSYLAWKLRRLNYTARFIDLANEINRHMPEYVVTRVAELLNEAERSIRASRILLLGMAYKRDVGDLRESPALDIAALLARRGAEVAYADPHVPAVRHEELALEAVPLTPELLTAQNLVLVTTDHAAFDWPMVRDHARLVLDTRGTAHGAGRPTWHLL